MAGNSFGRIFTVTSFGESHGPAIGCVVDGCPPGLALSVDDIQHDLDRRKPLLDTFAAIGGGWALPLTLRWLAKARARFGPVHSLVATNGVRSGLDVARCLLAGAAAAEVCSIVMTEGYAALGIPYMPHIAPTKRW